ncbi:MAG: hypothetical protein KAW12_31200 [Candidatus Aminicenantes bacterium]|nr:hypothetical protein [Candidatus Aminicenantes bacterium]
MADTIMQEKREAIKKEFLQLTPLQRVRRMNAIFNDMIALKAKTKGVPEYEIYRSYLKSPRRTGSELEDKSQLI